MTDSAANQKTAVCPSCGQLTAHDANYCEHCGSEMRSGNGSAWKIEDASGYGGESGDGETSETLVISPEARQKLTEMSRQPMGDERITHAVAFKTDIGLSHHVNQDAGGVWTGIRPDGTPVSVVAVADGVSAGRHSEAASRLTVEIIQERLTPRLQDPDADVEMLLNELLETARVANRAVAQRPHQSLSSADATTLVAAVCVGEEGAGVWCGDSRVYCINGDAITQLTRDHSWAEGVVSHGIMSREDASRDPRAHMITRWLGPPEQDDPGFETFRFGLAPEQIVLCCTDGLYMYFAPPATDGAEISRVMQAHLPDLQAGIDHLVQIALERGGRDNITAAAIQVALNSDEETEKTNEMPSLRKDAGETVQLTFPKNGLPQQDS